MSMFWVGHLKTSFDDIQILFITCRYESVIICTKRLRESYANSKQSQNCLIRSYARLLLNTASKKTGKQRWDK